MQVPVNPMDYKKLVRKTIGVIVGTFVIFAIGITLVILVLQPIIWVTNMLGRISEMTYLKQRYTSADMKVCFMAVKPIWKRSGHIPTHVLSGWHSITTGSLTKARI